MKAAEQILDSLKRFNSDEAFFKGCYEAEKQHKQEAFLEKNRPEDPALADYVKDPKTIEPNKTEEMFFTSGRNVTIVKHPRYLPVFDHTHSFFEILYVVTGHCRQLFPDKTMELLAGDCCLIAPGVHHAVSLFDDSIVLNILIRQSTFLDIFLHAIQSQSQLSLFFLGSLYNQNRTRYLIYRTKNDQQLLEYVLEMLREQDSFDAYSDRILCALLTIFFNQLTRRCQPAQEHPVSKASNSARSEEILGYIMNNYDTVSIHSLSEHFHFSEPYCSRLVKEVSGCTFTDLLTSIRMRRSENLLIHTQLSVEEISSRVGYKNPESYIRCFKRIYQISPTQYRRNPEHASVCESVMV